jgi:BMFP domain-containing protein YqiC
MSEQQQFLARMRDRLGDLEAALRDLEGRDEPRLPELRAGLAQARERLAALRREGAELSLEATSSYARRVERLSAEIGAAARVPN